MRSTGEPYTGSGGKIVAIGIDEIASHKRHEYLTPGYQINEGGKRLLWIGRERTEDSQRRLFRILPQNVAEGIEFVCSDLWKLEFTRRFR